jgi:hypothetical protein
VEEGPVSQKQQRPEDDAAGAGGAGGPADRFDIALVGLGVVAVLCSALPYYTSEITVGTATTSGASSAWHGFHGYVSLLLAAVGSLVVALRLAGVRNRWLDFPTVVAVYAVALFEAVAALVVVPDSVGCGNAALIAGVGCTAGHGIGAWLGLIVIVSGLALAVVRALGKGAPAFMSD